MVLTLVNSAVILCIIWIMGGGGEGGGGGEVGGESAAGEGDHSQKGREGKFDTDMEVLQVLRKLQAYQVKQLNLEAISSI